MKIRNKILLYFSSTVIALTIMSSAITYVLVSEYREEEFQQRLREKILYTIGLISEYRELHLDPPVLMDRNTIHGFTDAHLLLFDQDKNLIYQSENDMSIRDADKLLRALSPAHNWIELKENTSDIIAVSLESGDTRYYALCKAHDAYGYSKLGFLKNVLLSITVIISIIVWLVTVFLSGRITRPIGEIAEQLGKVDIAGDTIPEIHIASSSYELDYLAEKFNQLIQRTNEAFAFQKHTVHHISHQLKTPVAVLVSELERIEKKAGSSELKADIQGQILKAKSLGDVVNILLEISKIESGNLRLRELFRLDELIFDIIAELNILHPDFKFEVNYLPSDISENKLEIHGNRSLIRHAFLNVLMNSMVYSDQPRAEVLFDCDAPDVLKVIVKNQGKPISIDERKWLFRHFFRGENGQGKPGFGLGLVLSKKIFEVHHSIISYANPEGHLNVFEIRFPLDSNR